MTTVTRSKPLPALLLSVQFQKADVSVAWVHIGRWCDTLRETEPRPLCTKMHNKTTRTTHPVSSLGYGFPNLFGGEVPFLASAPAPRAQHCTAGSTDGKRRAGASCFCLQEHCVSFLRGQQLSSLVKDTAICCFSLSHWNIILVIAICNHFARATSCSEDTRQTTTKARRHSFAPTPPDRQGGAGSLTLSASR